MKKGIKMMMALLAALVCGGAWATVSTEWQGTYQSSGILNGTIVFRGITWDEFIAGDVAATMGGIPDDYMGKGGTIWQTRAVRPTTQPENALRIQFQEREGADLIKWATVEFVAATDNGEPVIKATQLSNTANDYFTGYNQSTGMGDTCLGTYQTKGTNSGNGEQNELWRYGVTALAFNRVLYATISADTNWSAIEWTNKSGVAVEWVDGASPVLALDADRTITLDNPTEIGYLVCSGGTPKFSGSKAVTFNIPATLESTAKIAVSAEIHKQGAGRMIFTEATGCTAGIVVDEGAVTVPNTYGSKLFVNEGATYDIHYTGGVNDNASVFQSMTLHMNGGTIANFGTGPTGGGKVQFQNFNLLADSIVDGTKDFYFIASSYNQQNYNLNGYKLTKKGSNTYYIRTPKFVGGGEMDIQDGTVVFSSPQLDAGNTLKVSIASGKALTIDNANNKGEKGMNGNFDVANNGGTITLSQNTTFRNLKNTGSLNGNSTYKVTGLLDLTGSNNRPANLTVTDTTIYKFLSGEENKTLTLCTGTFTRASETVETYSYVGDTLTPVTLTYGDKTVTYATREEGTTTLAVSSEHEFNNTAISQTAIKVLGTEKVVLKNINSADLSKVDVSNATCPVEFYYDCTTANLTADNTLKEYIKAAGTKVTFHFVGAGAYGATIDISANVTFGCHMIFEGGVHNFKRKNEGGTQKFGQNGTDENPTILVKSGTLNFYGRDVCGWNAAADMGGVVRVNSGATLNLRDYSSNTFFWSQRFYLEPGSETHVYNASGRLVINGGNSIDKPQIYVPASNGGVALVKTETNGYFNIGKENNPNAAVFVGAGSTLKLDCAINELSGKTGNTLGKYGEGKLVITGAASTPIFQINYGALELSSNSDVTFGSVISGSGDVIKSGTGTHKLSGSNTFAGKLYVDEGTVDLAAQKTGGYDIVSKGNITTSVGGNAYANYIRSLELVGNTTIGSEGAKSKVVGFGYGADTPATTLKLGTHTLTVWAEGNFYFLNTAISGSGTIDFKSGNFLLFAGNLSSADATLKVASGATVEPGSKELSFKNIEMNGSIYSGSSGTFFVSGVLSGSGSLKALSLLEGSTIDASSGSITVSDSLWFHNAHKVIADVGATVITKSGGYGETMPSVTRVDAQGNTLPGTYSLTNNNGVIKLTAQTSTEMTATELNSAGIMFVDSNASLTFDTAITGTPQIQNLSSSEVTLTLKVSGEKKYVSAADIKKLNLSSNIKLAYDWNASRVISMSFGSNESSGTALMSGDTVDGTLGGNVKRSAWNNISAASGTVAVPNGYQNGTTEYHVSGMSATITCRGNYRTNSAKNYPFMKGYLDDNNNNNTATTITLNGVPFKTYDLVIYCQSDGTSNSFSPVKIVQGETATTYHYASDGTVESTTDTSAWGGGDREFSYEYNTIRITGLTGQSVTITSDKTANTRRSCFAAVQVVQTSTDEEDAELGTTVATVDGTEYKTLGAAVEAASAKITEGAKTATVTLVSDLVATAEVVPAGVSIEVGNYSLTGALKLQSGALITKNGKIKIDGIATSLDVTYGSGTINECLKYSAFGGLSECNGNSPEYTEAGDAIKLAKNPWLKNVEDFFTTTEQITFATAGIMPTANNTIFAHMGSKNTWGLFLATGTEADQVIVGYNQGTTPNTITTINVPNARTHRHTYIITKDDDMVSNPTKTTFTIYLDGVKWKTFVRTPRFEITGGFQVGSTFEGIISNYSPVQSSEATAYVNFMRAYQRIISKAEIDAYTEAYPYTSPNGTYERTIDANGDWISSAAWTSGQTTVDKPSVNGNVKLTATHADEAEATEKTVTVNLTEAVKYEKLTLEGDPMTFSRESASTEPIKSVCTVIGTTVTLNEGAIDLTAGPTILVEGGKLVFDFSSLTEAVVAAHPIAEKVTGDIEEDENIDNPTLAKVVVLKPNDTHINVRLEYIDGCYWVKADGVGFKGTSVGDDNGAWDYSNTPIIWTGANADVKTGDTTYTRTIGSQGLKYTLGTGYTSVKVSMIVDIPALNDNAMLVSAIYKNGDATHNVNLKYDNSIKKFRFVWDETSATNAGDPAEIATGKHLVDVVFTTNGVSVSVDGTQVISAPNLKFSNYKPAGDIVLGSYAVSGKTDYYHYTGLKLYSATIICGNAAPEEEPFVVPAVFTEDGSLSESDKAKLALEFLNAQGQIVIPGAYKVDGGAVITNPAEIRELASLIGNNDCSTAVNFAMPFVAPEQTDDGNTMKVAIDLSHNVTGNVTLCVGTSPDGANTVVDTKSNPQAGTQTFTLDSISTQMGDGKVLYFKVKATPAQ